MIKRSLGTVAVLAGLLTAAVPAHAGTLGGKNEVAIETLESGRVFSGDAYDNEMGVRAAWLVPEVDDEVLAAGHSYVR